MLWFCSGRARLFDNLPTDHIELNLARRLTTPEDRTWLR